MIRGRPQFHHRTQLAAVIGLRMPLSVRGLFVYNGHVRYRIGRSPFRQPAYLYRNVDGWRFKDMTAQGAISAYRMSVEGRPSATSTTMGRWIW